MDLNAISKNFYFINSHVTKVTLENSYVDFDESSTKNIHMDVKTDSKLGLILMCINVEAHNKISHFQMDFCIEGNFENRYQFFNDEEFDELLHLNGASLLYSIARGKIESITANVFERGKITLPIINMVEYYSKRK